MSEERLLERFVRYCEIPSITGNERAMIDAIAAELRELGIDSREDDAAGPARAGAGNLIAHVPPSAETAGTSPGGTETQSREWVSFFAHVDTVPHDEPIVVVEADGVFRTAGDTILGADNKAAVAVVMELAARLAAEPGPVGLELVFTVAEEQGLRGAAALDVESLRSEFGYVLDHATPIGEVIVAAPTYKKLIAEFRGVESHAGMRPEDGRSAIGAATAAIATMDLGRLDDETTANIGVIDGGTAPNVVAGRCHVEGEARGARRRTGRGRSPRRMVDACSWAAGRGRRRRRPARRDLLPRLPDQAQLAARWRSPGGARRARHRAGRGHHRRRQRRQRLCARRASTRCCSPTGPRRTTLPTSRSRRRRW